MEKQFVKDLKVGDRVRSPFAVTQKQLSPYSASSGRAGQHFLKLVLADRTGVIEGRVWEGALAAHREIAVGDVLVVTGVVSEYNRPQITVESWAKCEAAHVNPADFRAVAARSTSQMLGFIRQTVDSLTNPFLCRLLHGFLEDREFMRAFVEAPAAKVIHHAYVGGLLEHTMETVKICELIASLYPEDIDRDLLLTAAVLHDVGKVVEYQMGTVLIEVSDPGKLIGHVVIGKEMVDARVREIKEFPHGLHMELAHMVLAHHGEREWGSPVVPRTVAACALHYADLLGARVNQFAQVSRGGAGGDEGWTDWDRFLDRSLKVPAKGSAGGGKEQL